MSVCVEDLRTFVIERLTVAAEEILRVFQQKIEGYEDEVNYQRRLVESVWRPEIKLHRIEFSQPPVCQDEEVPAYQQQDRSSSLDQEDSEPPPIKEEQEEPWCHQEDSEPPPIKEEQEEPWCHQEDSEPPPIKKEQGGGQLTVKQRRGIILGTPINEKDDQSEDQILNLNPAQSDEKSEMDTTVGSSVPPEPDCDQQLLPNSPHVAESKDQEDDNNKDSESTADEELKPTVKQNKRKRHRGNANNPADSAVDCDTHTGATSATFTTGEKPEQFKSDLTGHWRIQSSDNQAAAAIICGKGLRGSGCEVTSSAQSESDERIKAHTGEKSYLCKTSGNFLNQKHTLIDDIRVYAGKKKYSCKTCGKSFRYSCSLKRHARVHTGENPYTCKTCGKLFNCSSNLSRHARVHTGEKPYTCKTCGKSFSCNSYLSRHARVHTGEKPYACKTCGKSFSQSCNLAQHVKVHTGEKPYTCKTCKRAFRSCSRLTEHMRVHTGEKPYLCKTCGRTFSFRSTLNKHVKVVCVGLDE